MFSIFIHSLVIFVSITKVDNMSLQLALSSAVRFTIIYFPRPVQSIIFFIHTLLGAPTFLFPSYIYTYIYIHAYRLPTGYTSLDT